MSGVPCRMAVCHAGLVETCFPPHELQRRRWPTSGTCMVSDSRSTLTSADRPQLAQVAVTLRTPLARMLAKVMGGPGWFGLARVLPICAEA
jgi:hypothetical protein